MLKQFLSARRYAPLMAAAALLFLGAGATGAEQPGGSGTPDPTGEWRVAKGYATVRIVDCAGRLWGVIASETYPSTDSKNPDPKLRSRPTLGMPILLAMERKEANQWDGQVYNSQDGHTYSASISLLDPNTLRVKGCFLGVLCGGENWTRVAQGASPDGPATRSVPQSTGSRQADSNAADPTEQICLGILGAAGSPHQRGLK